MWEAFTREPFMVTLPFLQASAAIERVLNMREAHNHLSMRAFMMKVVEGDYLPLKLFMAKLMPLRANALIASVAFAMRSLSRLFSSAENCPNTKSI